MSLVDDLKSSAPDGELDRREVLGKLTGAALGVAVLGTAFTTIRYLQPNVLFEAATRFRVGRPEDIDVGTLLVLPQQKIYVAHTAEGFFAMSSTCTHLGCMTRYLGAEKALFCPCHGSRFDLEGKVTEGPAPRPLHRLHLSVSDGELVVDSRQVVDPDFILRA